MMRELDFSKANVLVIGDVMLDRYYYGGVSRISPEAPVPVVAVESESSTLGGAGNVVNNIKSLRANAKLLATATDDLSGKKLKALLEEIQSEHLLFDINLPTTTKLRVIGSNQQIVRLDFEEAQQIPSQYEEKFNSVVSKDLKNAQVAIISDYGKGVCTDNICQFLIIEANKQNKITIVDPKGSNWDKYKNATIVTPNVKELSEVFGHKIKNTDEEILYAGAEVRKKYDLKYLIVTRSEKGITIIADNNFKHFPAEAREVFDVSGAGDTVVATMAAAFAAGYGLEDAVSIANTAAGIVVGKTGTSPITFSELSYTLSGFHASKITSVKDIEHIIKHERLSGKKIVFTNGCFDILHKGHVAYLKKARELGDLLILGLNSDKSVKRLKGESRPINDEFDRAFVLEGLEAVDFIVIFDEDTPLELIKLVQPDVLVKGGDYKAEDVVGKEFAATVKIIDFVDGYSTTGTIDKLKRGK